MVRKDFATRKVLLKLLAMKSKRKFNSKDKDRPKFASPYLHLKFIHSEKATNFCEIFILLLTVCTVVKSKVKISKKFVAFSEYMNFTQKV